MDSFRPQGEVKALSTEVAIVRLCAYRSRLTGKAYAGSPLRFFWPFDHHLRKITKASISADAAADGMR
jgi:hypothetical protein